MVQGIDSFREKFKDYTDYYTIIDRTNDLRYFAYRGGPAVSSDKRYRYDFDYGG